MKKFLVGAATALALVGTPAMVSAQQSAATPQIVVSGKYQKDWNKGSQLEAEGLQQLEKAKKNLVGVSADVVNAQNKRDSSHSRAENARQTFENLTTQMVFSDPEEAHKWARQVESSASDWAKYHARRDDGVKELRKAQKRQESAQEDVAKAQAKIDKGRTLMVEAERASMRQPPR